MKKIENIIPFVIVSLSFLTLFRTCGIGSDVKRTNKKIIELNNKIDSLNKIMVTEEKLQKKLETTVMWETLVIEELSDKQKMPINHYKNQK